MGQLKFGRYKLPRTNNADATVVPSHDTDLLGMELELGSRAEAPHAIRFSVSQDLL